MPELTDTELFILRVLVSERMAALRSEKLAPAEAEAANKTLKDLADKLTEMHLAKYC